MSEIDSEFSGPAVGYGRVKSGARMVHLYASNCFLNTDTARALATDLLIWAQRIDDLTAEDGSESEEEE